MRLLLSIVLALVVSGAFSQSAAIPKGYTAAVVINPLTEVETKAISLAQIAEIAGPESLRLRLAAVSIGVTPRVGSDRVITPITIQSALRSAGIDVATVHVSGPQAARVRRATRVLPPAELSNFATAWIEANLPDAGPIRQTGTARDLTIASGETTFFVTHSSESPKNVIVTIQILVDGDAQSSQQLVFAKGEAEGPAALPALKPNQVVRVVLVSGEIAVEVFGQVKGISGTRATVFIPDTKATLTGEVRADGSVEVRL